MPAPTLHSSVIAYLLWQEAEAQDRRRRRWCTHFSVAAFLLECSGEMVSVEASGLCRHQHYTLGLLQLGQEAQVERPTQFLLG
jgi:hypothetical protein